MQESSKAQKDAFYTVYGWMIDRLGLKGNELMTYAIIYGYSHHGQGYFYGGIAYIQKMCGNVTKQTVITTLHELCKKNLIIAGRESPGEIKEYRVNPEYEGVDGKSPDDKEEPEQKENIEEKNSKKDKKSEENELVEKVVECLNKTTGKRYRATSESVRSHILARIREGATFEEFQEVIQKMNIRWRNTEMAQYLRPRTLFGPKFEDYLNSAYTTFEKMAKKDDDEEPLPF